MQGVVFCHSEPPELEQLCCGRNFALLRFDGCCMLTNSIDRFLDCDISDIIVTHQPCQTAQFEKYVSNKPSHWPTNVNISLCALPRNCPTGESFNRIRNHITSDHVFITSSTTFLTDLDLRHLFLSLLRTNSLAVATLSSSASIESKLLVSTPRELVVTARNGSQIVGYFTAVDLKKHTTLPRSLLTLNSDVLIRNDLRDVEFYLLTREAIEAIIRLRDDPLHRKKSVLQLLSVIPSSISNNHSKNSEDESELDPYEARKMTGTCLFEHKDKKISFKITDPLVFSEATRMCLQNAAVPSETVGKKSVSKDYSRIARDCVIGEKSMINGSLINPGCTIGSGCRIINSILLSDVVVKENCILQGCILGEKSVVEQQCNLKNCAVASSQRVPDGTKLESEQLGFTDPELEIAQG